jgi:hypothetical protein
MSTPWLQIAITILRVGNRLMRNKRNARETNTRTYLRQHTRISMQYQCNAARDRDGMDSDKLFVVRMLISRCNTVHIKLAKK